jgi:hypothetical protein
LYWEFSHPNAPFQPLLDWWSQNSYGKACYIGLGYYKAGTSANWRDRTLIPRQIAAVRRTPNVHGAIYFSSKSFQKNPLGWNDSLKVNYYKYPALVPPMPWIAGEKPPPPKVIELTQTSNRKLTCRIVPELPSGEPIRLLAVYRKAGRSMGLQDGILIQTLPFRDTLDVMIDLPEGTDQSLVYFTYVSHINIESDPVRASQSGSAMRKDDHGTAFPAPTGDQGSLSPDQ